MSATTSTLLSMAAVLIFLVALGAAAMADLLQRIFTPNFAMFLVSLLMLALGVLTFTWAYIQLT